MYKGGAFVFSFVINTNYPHDPPKVKCTQKVVTKVVLEGVLLTYIDQIYHPNVDLEGNVCLNILREDWKPVLNLNSVMVGLQYLFLEPNADDPLNKGGYRRRPSISAFSDLSNLNISLTCSLHLQRRPRIYAEIGTNS